MKQPDLTRALAAARSALSDIEVATRTLPRGTQAPSELMAVLATAATSLKDLCQQAEALETAISAAYLVVLTPGGVIEEYPMPNNVAEVYTIDCQNGEAGDIFTLPQAIEPSLQSAFGRDRSEWPAYIRLEHQDDQPIECLFLSPGGDQLFARGVYNSSTLELTLDLGGLPRVGPSLLLTSAQLGDQQQETLTFPDGHPCEVGPAACATGDVSRFRLEETLERSLADLRDKAGRPRERQ